MRTLRSYLLFAFFLAIAREAADAQTTSGPVDSSAVQWRKLERIFGFLRGRNANDYALKSPNAIDESRYVPIGGIEQYITIRGENRANPVLLFLHGGPGEATNPWAYAALRPWFKHFTVVQWDQRGAGRTLGRNGAASASTITIDRMVMDGLELSDYLRSTLKQDRIILVGHSWGSILGLMMAKARPELYRAYVGTGQVGARSTTTDSVAYQALVVEARVRGDERAMSELRDIGAPPWKDGRGFLTKRKWSNLFERADQFLPSTIALALVAPGYTTRDVNDWLEGQGASAERLVPETQALDAKSLGGEYRVPIFVIQGAKDFTTPTSIARAFVQSVQAPNKAFVALPDAGHFAVFMKSSAFLSELERLMRTLSAR